MAHFKTRLVMEPLSKGRRWRLTKPLVYQSDLKGVGKIHVQRGFECDLNSIPRLFWGVSPKTDYPEAGVIHDWAYRGWLSRDLADAMYREALGVLGMPAYRRWLRYWALRLFGGSSYRITTRNRN